MKRPWWNTAIAAMAAALVLTGCGIAKPASNGSAAAAQAKIRAVGAESEYADLIRQIGGPYVSVTAIMSNPAVDPHEYEANPKDAIAVAEANLIVQNGLGYDEFMNKLEQASPNPNRVVIDAGQALEYQANTANPHIWYQLNTMPRLAKMVAADLGKLDPTHAAYFQARAHAFIQSLKPWDEAVARLKAAFHGRGAAVTEPVSDYLLQEAGLDIKTPWAFQAAIMNGTDPSPQDVALQTQLFTRHEVGVFCYNKQVVTNVTKMFLSLARREHIPTVAVYETEPAGLTYQRWMLEETNGIYNALAHGTSLEAIS
ncbi:metal ABC transporter solute-binding protein, Zn/Mn family [Alicyclobacillus acidocaldarius]|uniref:Periplasmic solute binding protein n=1 Tax=Alicyclobacillus acidocaldarius subsp. acidocaldarius (strain ATCC 27009 / DSM 446 / BCRC 14685 / JCM 5260 / KCTC 1825 / NBRC 15652 / NCIMB 11725 / NRRL B-14509 / 104-IA) TaxID=521098 RepID=C8WTA3_ALIAD|nr:zinc ABC transporter substrate-binding protein [Alicyclobacillus acidocaldarius]ACV59617.1 periplasmic solute binding protein [Alicyclobacillus acidocaldarius subsp. acidocaldarius DSM 446]